MVQKKIFYVAELNLPNKSAYSIHVMKMCDAFAKLNYNVKLFTINSKKTKNLTKLYKTHYGFKVISIFKKPTVLNFLTRFVFSIKILWKNLDDESLILSRSITFALLASCLNKNVILELHHQITGFSKILFFILKNLQLLNHLKFIFLNKKLNLLYKIKKKKYLILDDAVNLDDYKINRKLHLKKLKKTCVYIGSFFQGKGIEQIFRLAKSNKDINFHLYGEKKYLKNKKKYKNIKVFDYINYSKVANTLIKYKTALMPYQNIVKGRSSINLAEYMSPLKMFDYLAAKKIIIASNLSVYKHILKNNYNCMLVKTDDDVSWSAAIHSSFLNNNLNQNLQNNAFKTAKEYTWDNRASKIINFIKFK